MDYNDYFQELFDDPEIWAEHADELRAFVGYGEENDAGLTVVVFPNLRDLRRSAVMTSKVVSLFRENGVRVIDLGEHLANRDPATLVVNAVDAHPSVALHHEVAELLHAKIVGSE